MGVGVAFGVLIFAGLGNEAREGGLDIGGDVGSAFSLMRMPAVVCGT